MRSPLLAFVLATATLFASVPAFADEAAARAHFKRGIELYDRKQYAEALFAFQDAYREKPSAGIKQNIALSLKALNRPAEAATALDEALDEGKDTLKPEKRAAIERELEELSKIIATVNLTAVSGADRRPVSNVVVTVLPAAAGSKPITLTADALRRPIRLLPGLYTFTAHAPGFADPPEKRLALVSGAPVDAAFVMGGQGTASAPAAPALGPSEGVLTLRSDVPDAVVRIDGVEVPQRGTFSGKVAVGTHHVEVSAPGRKTTVLDVNVVAGATIEQAVQLRAVGEAPAEYVAPPAKPVKPKRASIVLTAALDTVSYRLGVPLGEPFPYGTRRSNFGGASLGARGGYLVTKMLAVEGLLEVGAMGAKYRIKESDVLESHTTVVHWQLTPMLRFVTPGKVRFTAATGFGLHGLGVESKLAQPPITVTKKGSGVGFSWVLDSGIQIETGPVFFELALFLNVHGTGPVRDDAPPEDRFFYASPATRGGLRAGLGIPF